MYIKRLWLEKFIFIIIRIIYLPTWIHFLMTKPNYVMLPYIEMIKMNLKYKTKKKPDADSELTQQKKWAVRVVELARNNRCRNVLEIGCGHGVASLLMKKAGFETHAIDINDIRHLDVRSSQIDFVLADVCSRLPYENNSFDLTYSLNAMEHFPDPIAAFGEILRVTRPGGIIFLIFSPLFYSAWGLHAFRRLGMPYPQLLFSEETIQRFVDEKRLEIADTYDPTSDKSRIGPYLNRYSIGQYRKIFRSYSHSFKVMAYVESVSLDGLREIGCFMGLMKAYVPTFEDLIVSGIKFVALKVDR